MSADQQKIIEQEHKRLKDQVSHEEMLINNRMTWLLTIQGFLFAALALIPEEIATLSQQGASCNRIMCVMMDVIPVLGGTIAFLVFLGVFAAYISIDNTKHEVNRKIHQANEIIHGKERSAEMFQQKNSALASMLGRIVSMSVPAAIVLTWFYLSWKVNWGGAAIVGVLFWLLFLLLLLVVGFKVNAATKSEPIKL